MEESHDHIGCVISPLTLQLWTTGLKTMELQHRSIATQRWLNINQGDTCFLMAPVPDESDDSDGSDFHDDYRFRIFATAEYQGEVVMPFCMARAYCMHHRMDDALIAKAVFGRHETQVNPDQLVFGIELTGVCMMEYFEITADIVDDQVHASHHAYAFVRFACVEITVYVIRARSIRTG